MPASTLSAVYYAVRAISDPTVPSNGGCFRAVETVLPPGSLVNPRPPAPVSCRTATIKRIADTILGALVRALPDRMPAASSGTLLVMAFGGVDPETGRPFVASELAAGGMGARPTKDGIHVVETDVTNCMNIPVEALEMNFPLRIARAGLWMDSAGAGAQRGGLGLEKVFEATTTDVTVAHRSERFASGPWGLFGGRPARRGRAFLVRRDGTREAVPSKKMLVLHPGDQLWEYVSGGAGWGDPLDRDPERVLADVLDRVISAEAAAEEYAVVLSPDGTAVDHDATKERREAIRRGRGPEAGRGSVEGLSPGRGAERPALHVSNERLGQSIVALRQRRASDAVATTGSSVVPRIRRPLDTGVRGCQGADVPVIPSGHGVTRRQGSAVPAGRKGCESQGEDASRVGVRSGGSHRNCLRVTA